jgi:hypothetical protein
MVQPVVDGRVSRPEPVNVHCLPTAINEAHEHDIRKNL